MKIKLLFKRAKFLLQLWDAVWSFPLAIALFIGFGALLQWIFYNPQDPQGGPGFYDPSFLQLAIYAGAMQVAANFCVMVCFYFDFRGIWRYYIGRKKSPEENGEIENLSKNDFNQLAPWQRIKVLLFLYCFLSAEWLFLFSALK
jgi:hypothetical protein